MGLAVLIPLSLAMGLCGLAAFVWALRAGQFDDLDGAAARVLNPASPKAAKEAPDGQLASDLADRDPDRGL